jgi:heme-degrading monooxygenase HmoA
MPTLPWKSFDVPDADADCVVMASSLPLRRYGATIRFFRYVQAIRRQLAGADGLIGYSLWAKPLARRYCTLSIWRDEAALDAFIRSSPHVEIMTMLRPAMGPTKFVRWTVKGSAATVLWDDALQRLEAG